MKSWDELEAYLSRLAEKVGGIAYVLRDSGGRQLVPRPPAMTEAGLFNAILNGNAALARRLLGERSGENAPTDDAEAPPELRAAVRAVYRFKRLTKRFSEHSGVLNAVVGTDFVRIGPGKRYVHHQADFPFIAERFLSSYLLIIEFGAAGVLEKRGAVRALEKARSVICDMLEDLPPDDGGDRAVSNVGRAS